MTDKQIIIDGVDVGGCEYYHERYCEQVVDEDGCYVCLCAEDKYCYYKQLKRKEQECEELKIYIESNEQQVKEVEKLVMDNDRLINELDQLKQTLIEIKEIAKKQCVCGVDCIDMKQILQKISECEGNDD